MLELRNKFDLQEWVNPTWTDLILGELAENEISVSKDGKKYPRVRGLRRIGSYITNAFINCEVISCNEVYAACKATAVVCREDGRLIVASSMAEATPANVNNDMIAKHLLATAESRAEGRCWTKVLKLNCLTAEEMSLDTENKDKDAEKSVDIDKEEAWSSDIQKKMINNKSKKLDINPMKYAELLAGLDDELSVASDIKDGVLSKKLAARLIEALDKVTKDGKKIPEDLQGFVSL
jgi:hypothetical protein